MRDKILFIGVAVVAVVAGALVFLSGRAALVNTSSVAAHDQSPAAAVQFAKLIEGKHSIVSERVNYFITSSDQLNALWKMIDATTTPPVVDFNTQAVVAVFAGEKPTTGYAVTVARVEDSGARLVSVRLTNPDNSCMVGQSLTAPYEVVVVPATTLPLTHEDIVATTSCK